MNDVLNLIPSIFFQFYNDVMKNKPGADFLDLVNYVTSFRRSMLLQYEALAS